VALPTPNLDDRRFQDYVDEAKRMVQQRCPEWSDHNVSDPGVTLIETFAYMVDQLGYRLNLLPDRNYVKFLELIGVQLFPPSAAEAPLTFWLGAPQGSPVLVPKGAKVATQRMDRQEPVVFETVDDLTIASCSLARVVRVGSEGESDDRSERVGLEDFPAFSAIPIPGETLLFGLTDACPSNIVDLRFQCHIEGVGVDPENPPLIWEAYDGGKWLACEIERDETGGLNKRGDIVLHVPKAHEVALIDGVRAGWLRCRVLEPFEGQPFYSSSPSIEQLQAFIIGGTTTGVHATGVEDEILGLSEGIAAQRFTLLRTPIVPSETPHVVEVAADDGWEEWSQVDTFAASGEDDRHFMLDYVTGELLFGPLVRLADGSTQQYGAVPPKGATIRIRQYRSGGGRQGNVSRGALSVMKSSVPFVGRVENRQPASGGVDGEEMENAKQRGPVYLRTLGRAVTLEDYEMLAQAAAPGIARVKAVPASVDDHEGGVRVLVVPAVADDDDASMPFARLAPSPELLQRVAAEIDSRRTIGARVVIEPPYYQGITVVSQLRTRVFADPARVRDEATAYLYSYLHPIYGGAEGTGWPFGRPVHAGEIYSVLQHVPGVELVEAVQIYPADPVTGERGQVTQRLEISSNALLFSYGHEVRAVPT